MQKDKNMSLRLNKEDYDAINKNAELLGITPSEYIRRVGTSRLCRLIIRLTRR